LGAFDSIYTASYISGYHFIIIGGRDWEEKLQM